MGKSNCRSGILPLFPQDAAGYRIYKENEKSPRADDLHYLPAGSSRYLKNASSSSDTFRAVNECQIIRRGGQKQQKSFRIFVFAGSRLGVKS
jgi:hypothetical protein